MRPMLMVALAGLLANPVAAQEADAARFSTGPVFADFGMVADIETSWDIPAGTALKHSFDVGSRTEEGMNRGFVSVARFINMHARAGVSDVETALVVHGQAANDLLNAETYAAKFEGAENASAALVRALLDHGVRVILCGQTAAGLGLDGTEDLIPGVEVALSAMTAHAVLQQQGYTVNPF